MSIPRLSPRQKPYPDDIEATLASYPQGPEGPIRLFRTLAHSGRILKKLGNFGLLDKQSPVTVKQREVLILRTSYLRHSSYEWGIHVSAFSTYAGLSEEQVRDTCSVNPDPGLWENDELLLMQVADELSLNSDLADSTWSQLRSIFSNEQILEVIALVGFYHLIAFFNNTLRVEQEDGTPEISERSLT